MINDHEVSQMKKAWNKRAATDSFHYVETKYWDGDVDKFFATGESRATVLIDPVTSTLGLNTQSLTALDLGCGLGRFTRALSLRFGSVVAVDISEGMIEQAKGLNDKRPTISFHVSDGVKLPIADNSIDFVYSYEVFQHMPSHAIMRANLAEAARVMRDGGFGLIHFRTGRPFPPVVYKIAARVPTPLIALVKKVMRRDPLTSDLAWRGADPISRRDIELICKGQGLSVLRYYEDPTHDPGTRLFALVQHGR